MSIKNVTKMLLLGAALIAGPASSRPLHEFHWTGWLIITGFSSDITLEFCDDTDSKTMEFYFDIYDDSSHTIGEPSGVPVVVDGKFLILEIAPGQNKEMPVEVISEVANHLPAGSAEFPPGVEPATHVSGDPVVAIPFISPNDLIYSTININDILFDGNLLTYEVVEIQQYINSLSALFSLLDGGGILEQGDCRVGRAFELNATVTEVPVIGPVFSSPMDIPADADSIPDLTGYAVAVHGGVAVVGAPQDDPSGAAYVLTRLRDDSNPGPGDDLWSPWNQLPNGKLLPEPGAPADALFGSAVDLIGDAIVVGAKKDGTQEAGSATVYMWNDDGITATHLLTAPVAVNHEFFGSSVAIDRDGDRYTLVVGAPRDSTNNPGPGAAYVFTYENGSWSSPVILTASDGVDGDAFGSSVDIDGNTIVVGAQGHEDTALMNTGAAYVFTRSGGAQSAWSQEARLLAAVSRSADDRFGRSVGVSGDTILVGADLSNAGAVDSGAAFVFSRPVSPLPGIEDSWPQTQQLIASDKEAGAGFGYSVSLKKGTAVIGANNHGPDDAGSVYLFSRMGTSWKEQYPKLSAGFPSGNHGQSVSFFGDTILAGIPGALADPLADPAGTPDGLAYNHRLDCGPGRELPPDEWVMISLACDIPDGSTPEDLFGDDLINQEYETDWVMYRRNAGADVYEKLLADESITQSPDYQSAGYWVISTEGGYIAPWGGSVTLAAFPPTQVGGVTECPYGCFEIPLTGPSGDDTERWNMVGNPYPFSINWSDVRVLKDGNYYSPAEAFAQEFMDKTIWKYNGNGYDSFDDITPGSLATLHANDGVWVKVKVSGLSLLLPATPSLIPDNSSAALWPVFSPLEEEDSLFAKVLDWIIPTAGAAERKGWYVRLTAEAPEERLKDSNNVFGQLPDSRNGYDLHDLEELAPFDRYLTIVFSHSNWKKRAGDYASDYRPLRRRSAWRFTVKTDTPGREIILSWDGPGHILSSSRLIDLKSGERIRPDKTGRYRFTMEEAEQDFRWIYRYRGDRRKWARQR